MLRIIVLAIGFLFSAVAMPSEGNYGHYEGNVVAEWLPDGRQMRLASPLTYISSSGVVWKAPEGAVIDGASIPKFAWSIIGGPFEGKYRNASVIHDVACKEKTRTWRAAHKVFYTGMLASGVDMTLAKIMYGAVYHFGPRWDVKVALEGISLPNAQTEINKVLAKHGSTAYTVQMNTRGYATADSGGQSSALVDIDLKLVDLDRKHLTEASFTELETAIRTRDISIEEIEDFRSN